jgi:hypothetical protein
METITEDGIEYILVSNSDHLKELLDGINSNKLFADKFKFPDEDLFISMLKSLSINYKKFTKKYFHYDPVKKLHVAQSEHGYVWISTAGLVARGTTTNNRVVNSCLSQYLVVSLLIDKAIELSKSERVYDVDSNYSKQLTKLSPALYHNLAFYIEVFCKAYLSLTSTKFPFTHRLPLLYQKTVEVMNANRHNDSLFQILVLERLYNFVAHIENMPKEFKEHNIKYNDNLTDDSVILFDLDGLNAMKSILELSIDFISDYFYMGTKTHYLETNVYQRMLERADTEEKKNRIREMYPHLANANKL